MLKRIFDIIIASIALLLFSPILWLIRQSIIKNLGKPAIFKQLRPGLNGKVFEIYKFRSMLDSLDEHGKPRPDNERLTPFGKKLRHSSLDELPSLWNVVKGDMSMVGPRPLLIDYLPLYSAEQARRHSVRPGITGWAQVNGRNALTWDEKFHLDIWYVDNQSFWLDVKILLLTLKKVLTKEGITSNNNVSAERFTGNE